MLIQGARVIDPANGLDKKLDMLIHNGTIAAVGESLPATAGEPVLDATGLVACPGLIDMHVHLRDPGQTDRETVATGSAAAAAGGFTAVACMPNTIPVCDSPAVIAEILEKARQAGLCRVYPVAAITEGEAGEALCNFASLRDAGAVGFSDDGKPVECDEMMQRAIAQGTELGMPVISHCEDLAIIAGGIMHKGAVSEQLGVPGMDRRSEDSITERECMLAEKTGGAVHIAHVSTAGSVEIIRQAKARGVRVTAETAPHYLLFTHEKLLTRDARFRMNPPLREQADVEAVIQGVLDGTLDCIVTDHAPHTAASKADFLHAPNGVVGLETSLAAAYTALCLGRGMPLADLIRCMSVNPARILGVPGGNLAVGQPADITLFDPTERWVVDAAAFATKGRNTPFDGEPLTGRVRTTILAGKVVFQAERCGGAPAGEPGGL